MGGIAEFLAQITPPDAYMTVVGIHPTKRVDKESHITSFAYTTETIGEALAFCEKHRDFNLYYTPNPLKRAMGKKPKKEDVACLRFVHVDIDDPSSEVVERLRSYRRKPTYIIFSGGGYQALWLLKVPVLVNGNIDTLERANKKVMLDLGGDKSAWNIDRILRLPGTINYPTAAKLKRGRVEVGAMWIECNPECQYDLADFIDRSADLAAEARKLHNNGASREQLHEKLADHPHVRDQADPERALDRVAELVEKPDPIIEAVNAQVALLVLEGKPFVMQHRVRERGRVLFRTSTLEDARKIWANRKVKVGTKEWNPLDLWMVDRHRLQYLDGWAYEPGLASVISGTHGNAFNLWRGWGMQPTDGGEEKSKLFLELLDLLAHGDHGLYEWLLDWIADIFQNPRIRPGTAITIRGGQGYGKGSFAQWMTRMLGVHALALTGNRRLGERFNDWFAGRQLLFADEATWHGNRALFDELKAIITEPTLLTEGKYRPATVINNYTRFIFATNSDQSALVEIDDRRYVTLYLDDRLRDNTAFWTAYYAEMNGEGPGALLGLLLKRQIKSQLRITPKTDELVEQKLLGLDDVGKWWRKMLLEPWHLLKQGAGVREEIVAEFNFGTVVHTKTLHDFYLEHCKQESIQHRKSLDGFGIALRRYLPMLRKREASATEKVQLGAAGRTQVYELPTLPQARALFEAAIGGPIAWPGPQPPPEEIDA